MKYILMMNANKANWDAYAEWSKADLQRNVAFMRAFSKELKDSGVFVATEGLGWPNEAKIVRAGKDGEPITDGVFAQSKEFLAGYWYRLLPSPRRAARQPRQRRDRQTHHKAVSCGQFRAFSHGPLKHADLVTQS